MIGCGGMFAFDTGSCSVLQVTSNPWFSCPSLLSAGIINVGTTPSFNTFNLSFLKFRDVVKITWDKTCLPDKVSLETKGGRGGAGGGGGTVGGAGGRGGGSSGNSNEQNRSLSQLRAAPWSSLVGFHSVVYKDHILEVVVVWKGQVQRKREISS